MIPFAMPNPGEFVNISQVVRITNKENGGILVAFSDGTKRDYSGDAATAIKAEVGFALKMYHDFKLETQRSIITATGLEGRPN